MAQSFRTAISFDGLASASSQALAIKVDGDTQNRVLIDAGGKITWGAGGSSAGDTTLYRSAANNLKTDDTFEASGLTISGNAAFDTNTLYVDATNNRVGIGNYPSTTLDVQGTINQPWGNAFTQDGVENTKFIDVNFTGGLGNHVDLSVPNNGSSGLGDTVMRLVDGGNVGIGAATPDTALHVSNATDTVAHFESTDAEGMIAFSDSDSTGNWYDRRIGVHGDDLSFVTNGARRMTIQDDGQVGIGTTTPFAPLQVFNSATDTVARLGSGDNGVYISFYDSGSTNETNARLGAYNDALVFLTAGSDRMVIKSDGDVGIGTGSPGQRFHVNSGTTNTAAVFESTDTEVILGLKDDTTSGNAHVGIRATGNDLSLRAGNTNQVVIYSGGTAQFAGAVIATDGTASAPALSFTSDTDTGMFREGADILALTTGGTKRVTVGSGGDVTLTGKLLAADGTASAPSLSFASDSNTGLYATGNFGVIQFSGNGTVGGYLYWGGVRTVTGSESVPTYSFSDDTDTGMYRSAANEISFTTAGSQRAIIKSDGDFAVDTDTLLVAASQDRVGVNHSSPVFPLHAYGATVDSIVGVESGDAGAYVAFIDSDSTGNSYDRRIGATGDDLKFQTTATDRMTIKADGKVGVGTTSPGQTFHVNAGTDNTVAEFESTDSEAYIAVSDNSTSSGTQVGIGAIGDALRLRSGNSNHFAMDSSGNVGIGTTSPDRQLDIEGNVPAVRLTDSNNAGVYHEILGDGASLSIEADDNNQADSSAINFKVDGTEYARLTSDGWLGIGTTSPVRILDVAADVPALRLTDNNNSGVFHEARGDGASLSIEADADNQASSSSINFKVDGSQKAVITSDGRLGIGTGSPSLPLHVATGAADHGILVQSTDSVARINMQDNSTTDAYAVGVGATGDALSLFAGSAERATIASSGKVGIGTTSPEQALHVNSGTTNLGVLIQSTNPGALLGLKDDTTSGNSYVGLRADGDILKLRAGNTNQVTIQANGNTSFEGNVTVPSLTLGSTAVTSTAAELNILDGVTATASELNILDGVTSTTAELNILDGVTSTASELNLVDGITAGTVSASKAVIADSNKDVTGFRNVTATGIVDAVNFKVNGGQGSDGQVLTSTGSGVAWEDATGGGSPGGSDGQIQYNNGSAFGGASGLHYDDGNARLGVGTTSPSITLHVNAGTANTVALLESTDTGAYLGMKDDTSGSNLHVAVAAIGNDLALRAGNDNRVRLKDDGKVGIGTNGPATNLHISAGSSGVTSQNPAARLIVEDDAAAGIAINTSNTGIGYIRFVDPDSNAIGGMSYDHSDNTLKLRTAGSDRVTIDSSGTATLSKLALTSTTDTGSDTSDGALTIGLTSGQHLTFDGNEIQSKSDDSTAATLYLQTDAGSVKFGNNTQLSQMVIKSSQTQIHSSAAALELHNTASGDQSVYHAYYNDSGTRYGYMGYPSNDDMYFKNENSGGQMYNFSPGSYIYWHVAGAYELRLGASELRPYTNEGLNLGASGAAWNHFYLGQGNTFSSGGYWTLRSRDSDRQVMEYTSSERFKKDIVDLPLDEAYQVLDARPIKFRGIDDDSSVPLEAGLSAESLHNSGFEYAVRYDEGHWGETPRAVYYEMLTAPLIKICKDQKDRIESLEAKVAALEAA